jgi:hypothetical protein
VPHLQCTAKDVRANFRKGSTRYHRLTIDRQSTIGIAEKRSDLFDNANRCRKIGGGSMRTRWLVYITLADSIAYHHYSGSVLTMAAPHYVHCRQRRGVFEPVKVYDWCSNFEDGFAPVHIGGGRFYINTEGQRIR